MGFFSSENKYPKEREVEESSTKKFYKFKGKAYMASGREIEFERSGKYLISNGKIFQTKVTDLDLRISLEKIREPNLVK